jgi:hypothetical protein
MHGVEGPYSLIALLVVIAVMAPAPGVGLVGVQSGLHVVVGVLKALEFFDSLPEQLGLFLRFEGLASLTVRVELFSPADYRPGVWSLASLQCELQGCGMGSIHFGSTFVFWELFIGCSILGVVQYKGWELQIACQMHNGVELLPIKSTEEHISVLVRDWSRKKFLSTVEYIIVLLGQYQTLGDILLNEDIDRSVVDTIFGQFAYTISSEEFEDLPSDEAIAKFTDAMVFYIQTPLSREEVVSAVEYISVLVRDESRKRNEVLLGDPYNTLGHLHLNEDIDSRVVDKMFGQLTISSDLPSDEVIEKLTDAMVSYKISNGV